MSGICVVFPFWTRLLIISIFWVRILNLSEVCLCPSNHYISLICTTSVSDFHLYVPISNTTLYCAICARHVSWILRTRSKTYTHLLSSFILLRGPSDSNHKNLKVIDLFHCRIGRRQLGQRKRKNAMETRWLTFGGSDSSLVPAGIGEEAIKFLQQVPLLDLCL